ncbi:hypothetical protein BegalDRAFT_2032 [Beggiatoa alba B18LD]|uniref:DUF2860 domain-containing protein n=1 Tax=Beggiatoa alba B18LD TaxID=395493 RepID=I3CH05_9GAMM|nr:hypothetical protein [Beggiatoa alba]EIJ42898.1 hypothetical protein BegalDRAFT_2032 [Beggiatoa alba B18LD]
MLSRYHTAHFTVLLATLALTVSISPLSVANEFVETSSFLRYDDNIGRATQNSDKETEISVQLNLSAGKAFHPATGSRFTLQANVTLNQPTNVTDLTQATLGFTGQYNYKFGLGAFAPRLSAKLSADYADFRSDIRDSWIYHTEIQLNKRIDEQWVINGGIAYKIRHAQDEPVSTITTPTDVFDQERISFFIGNAYTLQNGTRLSLSYNYHDGDIDSTATAPNSRLLNASAARLRDPAFGNNKVVYKLENTHTHDIRLEASWMLTDKSTVTIGYNFLNTTAHDDIEYRSNLLHIGIITAF